MLLSLETLTYVIRTGLLILVELIDLVNSVIIFLSQTILLRWLIFILRSQAVILVVLLFWISFLLLKLVLVLQWLSLHWKILIMLLSRFPLNSFPLNSQQDAPFHRIAYGYSRANWDGVRDYLRDIHGRISLSLVLLLLLVNFVSGFKFKLMYIFLIENNKSSLTHLHGFQLFVFLP